MTDVRADDQFPPYVKTLFWETDPAWIDLPSHCDYVIGRVLAHGGLDAIRWLRKAVGDATIRDSLTKSRGRALTPRDLRFCEALFDLPHDTVTGWLQDASRRVWDDRFRPKT
jgi:hypothetical protein